jgi:hypothetical protein
MVVTLFPQYFSAITQPLPPSPRISRQISEHLVFTHANLSFTKRNNLLGKITQPFPRIQAESKPIHPKGKQKHSLT